MAQVIVRNLEDAVKRKLQRRAARHGRSMEEEIRDILRDAVKDDGKPSRAALEPKSPSCSAASDWRSPFGNCAGTHIKPLKFD